MYSLYCDDICFYNDAYALDNQKIYSPVLTLEDNSAGSLEFTLPPNNLVYDLIRKMASVIVVKRDGEDYWAGRVVSGNTDFWNKRKFFCEGELLYLNDTIQPPAEYHNLTPAQYLQTLIDIHNSKVEDDKQFQLGEVTVEDPNNSIYRYTNYESTLECISKDLIDILGGHIRVRRTSEGRFIDYLADYPRDSGQVIRFGENLIEYTSSFDMTEIATVIVPTGKRLDNSPIAALDAYLTVASVNGGSIYVENEEAVANLGRIEARVEWPDVETASALLTKAQEWLQDIQFDDVTLEMNAVDLHLLNPEIAALDMLDLVRCISTPHGMDRWFPVTKITLYLDSPSKNQYVLGDSEPVSLTSLSSTRSSAITKRIDSMPNTQQVTEIVSAEAAKKMVLLWSNSSPSSTFGPQTVNLSSSGYSTVFIEFRATSWNPWVYATAYGKLGHQSYVSSPLSSSVHLYCVFREFIVNESSVQFLEGRNLHVNANSFSQSDDNNAFIPLKIWGVPDW